MKFGPAEGTPEEIRDFVENTGLKFSDYFVLPEPPLNPIWLVLPAVLYMIAILLLGLKVGPPESAPWVIFLSGCGVTVWLVTAVQVRFRHAWASAIVAIGCVALLLVAFGLLTPLDAVKELKSLK